MDKSTDAPLERYVIQGWNDFYSGWVAFILGIPRDDSDNETWLDGWDMAKETGDPEFVLRQEIKLGHVTVDRAASAPTGQNEDCPNCGANIVVGGNKMECAARCGWWIERAASAGQGEADAIRDDLLNAFGRFHLQMERCSASDTLAVCMQFPCQNARRVIDRVVTARATTPSPAPDAALSDERDFWRDCYTSVVAVLNEFQVPTHRDKDELTAADRVKLFLLPAAPVPDKGEVAACPTCNRTEGHFVAAMRNEGRATREGDSR